MSHSNLVTYFLEMCVGITNVLQYVGACARKPISLALPTLIL